GLGGGVGGEGRWGGVWQGWVGVVGPPRRGRVAEGGGGVGGSWCTNWDAYNAPALWEMVAADNACVGAEQTLAWRRVADALDDQVGVLSRYRDECAQAWSGEAGQEFVKRLDRLIETMRQTADAAAATCVAIDRINSAVASAQRDLQQIAQEYEKKSNDWVLRAWDGAEDELNERARRRMAAAEMEISSAAECLPEIPEFRSSGRRDDIGVDLASGVGPGVGGAAGAAAMGDVSLARRRPPDPLPGVEPVLPPGVEWSPGGGFAGSGPVLSGSSPVGGGAGGVGGIGGGGI